MAQFVSTRIEMCYCTLWYLDSEDEKAKAEGEVEGEPDPNSELLEIEDACSPGVRSFVAGVVDKAKGERV